MTFSNKTDQIIVTIPVEQFKLDGILTVPEDAKGIILFAHGSGSSRLSKRNQYVANELNQARMATLLFDLLTSEEERIDEYNRALRFDIELLAERLIYATIWTLNQPTTRELNVGYFGASTGGAAALVAAAKYQQELKKHHVRTKSMLKAVVSRGGRPDLAGAYLAEVKAPTLLIIGGLDDVVIDMNQEAMAKMTCTKKMEIVDGATHLFEEPGTLEKVANLAKEWFNKYFG